MEFTSGELWFAFSLTLLAGLSTGIGSALAFFAKKTNTKFLSGALGFSAGVMIYVAFVEIFAEAQESLISYYGSMLGQWVTIAAFFGGIAIIAIIDRYVPSGENPHEIRDVSEMDLSSEEAQAATDNALLRTGMFSAIAIAIHNFPEGLATFIAALQDPALGVSIAIAIAIHNIPEGIAVSVPIYYATGSKKKAFGYSFLSGLAEPLGAIVGYVFLLQFVSEAMFGIVFALVAGIMIYISLDELLPAAEKYGHHHIGIYGLVLGMAVMAVSLVLL